LLAGAIGFTIVILFMLLYYRVPGALADVSILIYAVLALALFRLIPVTLTLPGIAGFLLSTGSALDANILIFERMKEELRGGRPIRNALDTGWQRAWPSIRDSNIATLITCGILFWFGSTFGATIVKGFSLTLALGVVVSLFIAIIVTRTLLTLVLELFKPTNLSKWFGI
jgi:preprotein translocase subunit SecD